MSATHPAGFPEVSSQSLTIAEDVQLMLQRTPGRLEVERTIPVAGALIELALLDRIVAQPKKGIFVDPVRSSRLAVVDPTPTGRAPLDAALRVMVEKGKPRYADRCIASAVDAVIPEVHAGLSSRGYIRAIGDLRSGGGYLEIVDDDLVSARRDLLARARSLPETVNDPRVGAVVDLLRGGGNLYRGGFGQLDLIAGDWYPAEVRDTIAAILKAERLLCESQ